MAVADVEAQRYKSWLSEQWLLRERAAMQEADMEACRMPQMDGSVAGVHVSDVGVTQMPAAEASHSADPSNGIMQQVDDLIEEERLLQCAVQLGLVADSVHVVLQQQNDAIQEERSWQWAEQLDQTPCRCYVAAAK